MDSMLKDTFDRLMKEVTLMQMKEKKKTVSSLDIQTAVRFLLPGELCVHAVAEGTKAVQKYIASK